MSKPITWKAIYNDFKQRHPRLAKEVAKYKPHDYLMIKIWLNDGMTLTYDYMSHRATILSVNWIDEKIKMT